MSYIYIFHLTSLISPHYLVKHKSAKFVHKASRRWCLSAFRNFCSTEIRFIEPGVKVNGAYYRIKLLAQKLLQDIFWISQGGFFVFQHDAHRAHDTVAFLERKVLDFIPPILWSPNPTDLSSVDCL